MNRMIRTVATAAAFLLSLTVQAGAAGDVGYVGGAGEDERQAIRAQEPEYNLKIVAADKAGDYLADVQVVIESAKKQRVFETTMGGPILLVKLVPGTYTIRATSDARTLSRTVTLAAHGLRHADFRWEVSP